MNNKIKKFLIKFLGEKKVKRSLQDIKIEKCLLETSCQIGDCVILSPLLESLSKLNDEKIEIDIIVQNNSMEILKYYPYIKNIYPYRKYKNKLLRYVYNFYFALKNRRKYDLIISYEKGINTFHMLYLKVLNPKYLISSRKKVKYGITENELEIYDFFFENNEEIMKKLNLKLKTQYKIYLGPFEEIAKRFYNKDRINVIFNYIGSKKERIIPKEEVIEILKDLSFDNIDIDLFLSSIPSKYEENKLIIEEVNRNNVKLLPKTNNIFEIASYIKYSDIVISVDTSIVHIASAYNRLILGIYAKKDNIKQHALPNCDNWEIVESPYKILIKELDIELIKEKFKILREQRAESREQRAESREQRAVNSNIFKSNYKVKKVA
ncbi:glycosyltransferase family 9 protein [uncultured Fusobacterium sp.]|uniref:glycosyltransferase family 9 protein n=1 Tax=uncultured Fusobacterium sp. TaxID=159267 RepID=UPI0025F448D7|nr:glycosyltransferase family 9 protein [uncultured Fusobacterium sp.]